MGLRTDQLTPEIFARMAPADQAAYMPQKRTKTAPGRALHSAKGQDTTRLEREEQRTFANWCLKEELAFVWHSTAHKTKASVGCPDFIVQVAGSTLWIEFKRPGQKLSKEQEDFRARLVRHGAIYFIAYSANDAVNVVKRCQYAKPD